MQTVINSESVIHVKSVDHPLHEIIQKYELYLVKRARNYLGDNHRQVNKDKEISTNKTQ